MFGMGLSFTVLGFYFQTLEAEKENSFEGNKIKIHEKIFNFF